MEGVDSIDLEKNPTLLQIRESNIRKNHEFIQQLSLSTQSLPNQNRNEEKNASESGVLHSDSIKTRTNDLISRYPCRLNEISAIVEYIFCDSRRNYPLVVYGPQGSGKSEICSSILKTFCPLSSISVDCSFFESPRDIMNHLVICLLELCSKSLTLPVSDIHDASIDRDISFEDCIQKIDSLLTTLSIQNKRFIVICLDNIHKVNNISRGLVAHFRYIIERADSYLKLIEVSSSEIRVPRCKVSILEFRQYSLKEIHEIIRIKLRFWIQANEVNCTLNINEAVEEILEQEVPVLLSRVIHLGLLWSTVLTSINARLMAIKYREDDLIQAIEKGQMFSLGWKFSKNQLKGNFMRYSHLTDDLKLLLIAGYTCSISNPNTDYSIYVGDRRLKRSRNQFEGKENSSLYNKNDPHFIPFSLDRLVNVFNLLAETMNTNKTSHAENCQVGDAALISMILSLEEVGCFVQSEVYSIDNPQYYCTISHGFATQICASLSQSITNLVSEISPVT